MGKAGRDLGQGERGQGEEGKRVEKAESGLEDQQQLPESLEEAEV